MEANETTHNASVSGVIHHRWAAVTNGTIAKGVAIRKARSHGAEMIHGEAPRKGAEDASLMEKS